MSVAQRRQLALIVLAGFAVSSSWSPAPAAAAGSSIPIVVIKQGSAPSSNPAYELDDIPTSPNVNATYQDITGSGGASSTVTVDNGYSLGELMPLIAPGEPYDFIELGTSDGSPPIFLDSDQVTSTSATPPVVWEDAQGLLHFLAPAANGQPGRTFDLGEPYDQLLIYLHSGTLFDVTISVPKQATVGRSMRFTCTDVSGLGCPATTPSGVRLTYAWDLGDDEVKGSDASVDHTYSVPGTYSVSLEVDGNDGKGDYTTDGSIGDSQAFSITVGKAPEGPDRSGGGTSKKKTAPDSGAAVKGSHATSSPHDTGTEDGEPGTQDAVGGGEDHVPRYHDRVDSAPVPNAATRLPTPVHKPPRRSTSTTGHGALLRGIAIDAPLATAATRAAQAPSGPAGVTDPARRGQLIPPGVGWGEGIWLAVAALATLAVGATLQWATPRMVARWVSVAGQSG